MKNQILYLILIILFISCNANTEDKNNVNIREQKAQEKPIDKIKNIEKNEETKTEEILIYRKWRNTKVTLHISEGGIAFEYHGQCMYFYPIKKTSANEFEMIWSNNMDCSFDNGTSNTFNLKDFPTIGKPFAKFKLKNDILYAEYYYKDWVKKYTEQVAENVFTSKYFVKNEEN